MKAISFAAALVGTALIVLAVVYLVTPASSLPAFLPGHDPALAKVHYKHGVGSLVLGLGLLAYAWFSTRRR
jgi:hypothetical protein